MKFRVVVCLLVISFLCVDLSSSWRRRRRRRRHPPPPPPPKPTTTTTTTTTTPTTTTTTTTAEPTPKPVPNLKPNPTGCTVEVLLKKLIKKHGKKVVDKFLKKGFAVYAKYKKWMSSLRKVKSWWNCAGIGDTNNIQPTTAQDYQTILKATALNDGFDNDFDNTELEIYDIPVVMEDEWNEYVNDVRQRDFEDNEDMPNEDDEDELTDQDTEIMDEDM